MSPGLQTAFWPEGELAVALAALARHAGWPVAPASTQVSRAFAHAHEAMAAACAQHGLESEEVILQGNQITDTLRASAPAVLAVEAQGWLVLANVDHRFAYVLTPELAVRKVPVDDVRHMLCERFALPHRTEAERIVAQCGVEARRRAGAVDALVAERLRRQRVGSLHTVRVPPSAGFARQLRDAGVFGWLAGLIAAHAAEYAFFLGAWAVIGKGALQGRIEPGWLIAWLLLLAAMVPCRMLTTWAQGVVAVRAGGLLRQRLLAGILRLEPEEVRHEGAGAFMARAIEIELVESLALSGGLMSLLALVEMAAAAWVLGAAGAPVMLPLLVLWCALTALIAWRYWRARRTWTDARLALTHEVVERMVGHRTRLAQPPPSDWHLDEDQRLQSYLATSQTMDVHGVRLQGLIPRGWLLAGVLGLAPSFLSANYDPIALALSLGGVVLAWRALRRLTAGLGNLSGAVISWARIAPLFHAAARREPLARRASAEALESVIDGRKLTYRYSGHGQPVIDGLELAIRRGDQLLIEGESGGGKSTLVAMLAGLRQPTAGLLMSGGLDYATLGADGWRRRVSAAPQYHDNHILGGPFAYNLLLGHRWPPSEDDLREAEELARDVGLGPLLDRMPAGLMQMIGETGWQLSSGERSRLFLCRALLSRAELVVLDETFAALDPHTLRQALECSLRRAKSLLVVAHP